MTLSFDERLSRLAETEINLERIRVIERCFGTDNKDSLATVGRALVGEGVLIKVCRKKPKARYFFLFNDIMLYGTIVIQKKKYINPHITSLENIQIKSIADGDDPKLRNGWIIMSPKKSFCVYATTSKEKIEWMTHISNCIEKLSNNNRKAFDSLKNIDVAPQWIPDKETGVCMRCRHAKFTLVNRRHHCRNCGYVICGDCSKHRFRLPSQSVELLRVCNVCYETLTQAQGGGGQVTNACSSTAIGAQQSSSGTTTPRTKSKEELATNTDDSDESENEEAQINAVANDAQFYSKD